MKFRGKSLGFQIFSGKISLQFFLKIFSKNFRKIFPGFFYDFLPGSQDPTK